MTETFPCLFDVPKPHRPMEPVKTMRYGLPCRAEHNILQSNISVAEDSGVSAREPALRPHCASYLPMATFGAATN